MQENWGKSHAMLTTKIPTYNVHREYSIYTLSWECTAPCTTARLTKNYLQNKAGGGEQNKTINFKKSLKCRALSVHNSFFKALKVHLYFIFMSVLPVCMFVHHAVLYALLEEALDPWH